MEKNVLVTDSSGKPLGLTYPKRAKGLLKRGRAEFLSEHRIRMKSSCPAIDLEDIIMNNNIESININLEAIEAAGNLDFEAIEVLDSLSSSCTNINLETIEIAGLPEKLYFNARDWQFSSKYKKIGCRHFLTDFMGNMTEAYCIGNWHKEWTEIQSKQLVLKKNSDYVFTFWLNGGENDRYEEVCSFEILFNDDYENRFIYKLNRNYIKYSMYYKGWYLYEIPFTTQDNEYTQLRFSTCDAPCAIIPARDKSYYGNLPKDEPVTGVPQRHNLVFTDGYPQDSHWSWKVYGKNRENNNPQGFPIPMP